MTKKQKRKPRDPDAAGKRFLDQMGRYMKSRGWNIIVAGPIGLIRGLDNRHQLVIEFLGAEKRSGQPVSADEVDPVVSSSHETSTRDKASS